LIASDKFKLFEGERMGQASQISSENTTGSLSVLNRHLGQQVDIILYFSPRFNISSLK
jgi:hypothetical protein